MFHVLVVYFSFKWKFDFLICIEELFFAVELGEGVAVFLTQGPT